jgi:hypothetical protein
MQNRLTDASARCLPGVFDAVHLPYGCSVWGAFWTRSPTWPVGGEQDIYEVGTCSRASVYHFEPLTLFTPVRAPTCNSRTSTPCILRQAAFRPIARRRCRALSASRTATPLPGARSASRALGHTARRLRSTERQDVPRSLTVEATSIDPSTLGLPSAFWPAEGCAPISRYLHTQQAVINIALVCLQPSIGLKRVVADPITLRRPAVRSELPLSLELTHSDRSDASSYTPPRSGLAIPTQCVQADARHPSLRRHVVSL